LQFGVSCSEGNICLSLEILPQISGICIAHYSYSEIIKEDSTEI